MRSKASYVGRRFVALALALTLGAMPALAGLNVSPTNGITMTGADGITMTGADGITMTGADSLLPYKSNGITMTGADGLPLVEPAGYPPVTPSGLSYAGANNVRATHADGITMTGADGITMTGADGITMTGADGTTYNVNSVVIRDSNGITMTGADGITMTGADGITMTGADGITMTGADGVVMTSSDGITMTGADQVMAAGPNGVLFSVSPDGITMTGADGITMTGADGITMTGADGLKVAWADGITVTGADGSQQHVGFRALDPELAVLLDQATDDSSFNIVVTFHDAVTEADLLALRTIGVLGGTRYRALPMVSISAKPEQIEAISEMASVRSIWQNRTLQWTADASRETTGVTRTWADLELKAENTNRALSGRGVTVAVIDTGIDSTHADFSNRVVKNVKLAEAAPVNLLGGFNYPVNVENLSNTDQTSGHGTFVSGVVAGDGTKSAGKYKGVAPRANLVGLAAGDVSLLYVLSGFDYLMNHEELGVRVVNCSFSANTPFNLHDPVNVATRMLTERGINVVFSAGNTGPGLDTLNPYAMAPWVVSVGATDDRSRLADFSSRGFFGNTAFRPTIVAPGVHVVSLRPGSGGTTGGGAEDAQFTPAEAPYYTTASGTSFSAPQVAGVIALMLEANPNLTPAQVRDILQRTATPLPNYYLHEVGAGMLNAHAAALEAAFPERRFGMWRATVDRGQVSFIKEPAKEFSGTVFPGTPVQHDDFTIPAGALLASVQIAWGPMWSTNDLALTVINQASGATIEHVNYLNLPGLTGRQERYVAESPAAGTWRVSVANTIGLAGLSQEYSGVFNLMRVRYAPVKGIDGRTAESQAEIRRMLRTFVMFPAGDHFRPNWTITRADFAATLLRGARVPQYMPGQPTYRDVSDTTTMNYVESAFKAPGGPLFPETKVGGPFRPNASVDRLTAAIALVRAAGLRAEADNFTGTPTVFTDAVDIPAKFANYVQVAVKHGLVPPRGAFFRPRATLTRAELAHAMTVVAELADK